MRSGQAAHNKFHLRIGRLPDQDKQRVIQVLDTKLGLKAKLIRNGSYLSFEDGAKVISLVGKLIHKSQMHRLNSGKR